MTVQIAVPPEIETLLKGEASRCGLDVEAYATKLIVEHFPREKSDDAAVRVRGVFATQVRGNPLFSNPVAFRIEELPKWTPQVVLSSRELAEDEDE